MTANHVLLCVVLYFLVGYLYSLIKIYFDPIEATTASYLVTLWPVIMVCDVVGVLIYFKNVAVEKGLERRRKRGRRT